MDASDNLPEEIRKKLLDDQGDDGAAPLDEVDLDEVAGGAYLETNTSFGGVRPRDLGRGRTKL